MKDCKLIATAPPLTDIKAIEEIVSNKYIMGIRWNSGIVTPYSEYETLNILKQITNKFNKKLWLDLKGRQLRVIEWGNPLYSSIKVNHSFVTTFPAQIVLRGEDPLNIVKVDRNEIFVHPLPKHSVGAGQSVNILAEDVQIVDYLTEKDKTYLSLCRILNIPDIMASFVESTDDISEIRTIYPESNIVCKIESKKGVEAIPTLSSNQLMAARDDLYVEVNNYYDMIKALRLIIQNDKNAICASRIFSGLKHSSKPSFSDFEDLENMYQMGYRTFMLCDNVSNYCFHNAIINWEKFLYEK